MIPCEHIIGFSASDLGHLVYSADGQALLAQSAEQRFAAVCAAGRLVASGASQRTLEHPGSQRDYDLLAGDGRYIFLSIGRRYRDVREPELSYGFVFDAEELIAQGGLVGYDLLSDYEELADAVVREVDATLPPAAPISAEELAEFANLMGATDPGMLVHLREQSISHYWDILDGMLARDESVPGVSEALSLWQERLPALQVAHRKSGADALGLLRSDHQNGDLELLMEGELNLRMAKAFIVAGSESG